MRRTLKRTKNKKPQGSVRDLKAVKGGGKIEHAVERQESAITEDAKELKKLREESHKLNPASRKS